MYFRVIATEGSIANAASKLRVGQPALSAQLKTLEEFFGHSLFERRNRRLFLTEAGKVTLQYANSIFERGQELLEVIEDQTFTSKPRLQLGALDSVPKTLITRMVEEARKKSNSRVTVLEGRGDELLRELLGHQIDILVSNYPAPTTGKLGVFSRSLARVPVGIFAAPKYRALKKNFPKSLSGQPLILPTSHSKLRQDVDHYFEIHSLVSDPIAEIQDTSVQKLLAIDGAGLLPIPEFPVKQFVRDKKLVLLGHLRGVFEEFWMMSAKRSIENPAASHLMKNFKFSF